MLYTKNVSLILIDLKAAVNGFTFFLIFYYYVVLLIIFVQLC